MTIANLVPIFILLYQCIKGSQYLLDRLASAKKRKQSPLIGRITNYAEIVEPE